MMHQENIDSILYCGLSSVSLPRTAGQRWLGNNAIVNFTLNSSFPMSVFLVEIHNMGFLTKYTDILILT